MNNSYHMTVCKLFVVDRNSWYHIIVFKLFVLDKNTWYHMTVWKQTKKKNSKETTQKCKYKHKIYVIP